MRAWLLVLVLAGCEVVFPLGRATPPACTHEGLQLCLAFEDELDDGLAIDDSTRHFDATIDGVTVVERVPGEHAIQVDDQSTVVVDHVNEFDLEGPMSFDLWVQYAAVAPTLRSILDNELQYSINVHADNAEVLDCSAHIVVTPPDQDFITAPAGNSTPNTWHHLACVFESPLFRAYLDGEEQPNKGAINGPLFTAGTKPLRIGRSGSDADPRFFTGLIDNVRIWDRALTSAEIQKFANNEETE